MTASLLLLHLLSFILTPDGGEIVLACGVQLCFPRGAATSAVTICFQKCSPDPQWLKLRHHDILLSEVLELQPHGIAFQEVRAHKQIREFGWN